MPYIEHAEIEPKPCDLNVGIQHVLYISVGFNWLTFVSDRCHRCISYDASTHQTRNFVSRSFCLMVEPVPGGEENYLSFSLYFSKKRILNIQQFNSSNFSFPSTEN
jgi:hypothetical protein